MSQRLPSLVKKSGLRGLRICSGCRASQRKSGQGRGGSYRVSGYAKAVLVIFKPVFRGFAAEACPRDPPPLLIPVARPAHQIERKISPARKPLLRPGGDERQRLPSGTQVGPWFFIAGASQRKPGQGRGGSYHVSGYAKAVLVIFRPVFRGFAAEACPREPPTPNPRSPAPTSN